MTHRTPCSNEKNKEYAERKKFAIFFQYFMTFKEMNIQRRKQEKKLLNLFDNHNDDDDAAFCWFILGFHSVKNKRKILRIKQNNKCSNRDHFYE